MEKYIVIFLWECHYSIWSPHASFSINRYSYMYFQPIAWCSVGIGICRDLRYPELALHYAKKGQPCKFKANKLR